MAGSERSCRRPVSPPFNSDGVEPLHNDATAAIGLLFRVTQAGALLQRLRVMAMASENNVLKTTGGRFFVPAP
jgi:hypothetical protein